MDRRLFLRNAAILTAGAATLDQLEVFDHVAPRKLFVAWPSMPTLYGDAVHDDTLAVEAVLNGKPAFDSRTNRLASPLNLGKGKYQVSRQVDALHHACVNGAAVFVTSVAGIGKTTGTLADRLDETETNALAYRPIDRMFSSAMAGANGYVRLGQESVYPVVWQAKQGSDLILTDAGQPVRLITAEPELRPASIVLRTHIPTKPIPTWVYDEDRGEFVKNPKAHV